MAQDNVKPTEQGREAQATILGLSPDREDAREREPDPAPSVMPDSYGHMVAANAELFRKLDGLKGRLATAEALHDQAQHDLEVERAAHARTMRELENERLMVADLTRIKDGMRSRISELERRLATIRDQTGERDLQEALNKAVEAMAALCVAFKHLTGKDPLDAPETPIDPEEHQRLSEEIVARVTERTADSAQPFPSLPPTAIPIAPRVPSPSNATSSRSPRPEEIMYGDDESTIVISSETDALPWQDPLGTRH